MKRLLILGTSFLILLLTACEASQGRLLLQNATVVQRTSQPKPTPAPTIVDTGLAQGIPCQPPCWQGLVPGKTSASEAKELVDQLAKSGQVDHIVGNLGNYLIYLSPVTPESITVRTDQQGIVKIIRSSDLSFAYTIAELVERVGEPEYVYFKSFNVGAGSCQERQSPGEDRRYAKLLLYPQKGALFVIYNTLSEYDLICPDMLVTSFCYFPSMQVEDFLSHKDLASVCTSEVESTDLTQWHGFGSGY